MPADEILRVRYFERQFLGAVDFAAEQAYERDARRRHVLGHHLWGIIVGLELEEVPVTGQPGVFDVVLHPGAAIDGFGRELVAYHPIRLDPAAFDAFNTDAHQSVWLAYDEDQSGLPRYGFADCQDGEANRTVEGWRLVVSPNPPPHDSVTVDGLAAAVPPAPSGTPEIPADESVPYQELPQTSPGDRWLVRLGTVHWDGATQTFRDAAPGRLNEGRRYIGAVAEQLVSPRDTLAVRRRTAPSDVDASDFVTVEGRIRAKGRVNAEKEVWVEGDRIRFTYDAGDEENTQITLGRERPSNNAPGHRLRLRIGDAGDDKTALSVGADEGANATDVLRVWANNVVDVPTGVLTFGQKIRQMVNLWSTPGNHEYGIGVQSSTLYLRSANQFAWFKGGDHADGAGDPGGGQLQMRLNSNGDLYFGSRVRQMLNLWGSQYGIGVQSSTLYFRSNQDFAWFRGGVHDDTRGSPGGGGAKVMWLDDSSHLRLVGHETIGAGTDGVLHVRRIEGKSWFDDTLDHLYLQWGTGKNVVVGSPRGVASDLRVSGDLLVDGRAPSVIKVKRRERAVQNVGVNAPVNWTEDFSADFDEVYDAFVTLNGFSAYSNTTTSFDTDIARAKDLDIVIQHVYARVTAVNGPYVSLRAFCAQSEQASEGNNSMLVSIVAFGRDRP
jgi:hypothetical protein